MCFPICGNVEVLKINGSPRSSVLLGDNNHASTPFSGHTLWDWLNGAQLYIAVKVRFNRGLPVVGHRNGWVENLPWASGRKWAVRSWPVISGRVWCSQVLKAEEAKWDKSHCSNLARFSLVGGYGSSWGMGGESCCKGQPQGAARVLYGDPVGGRGSSTWETWEVSWDGLQNGYEGGIIYRSSCAFSDR